jgi:hypothetical protein
VSDFLSIPNFYKKNILIKLSVQQKMAEPKLLTGCNKMTS